MNRKQKNSKTNFYHFAQEISATEYSELEFSGRSVLIVGKGKNKRFFLSLFVREHHKAGIVPNATSKGYKGNFFIIHHLGYEKPEIDSEVIVE